MANPIEVLVPDIGGFKDVSVIDVLVKDGQQIDKETPLDHHRDGKGGDGRAGAGGRPHHAGQAQAGRQGIRGIGDPVARDGRRTGRAGAGAGPCYGTPVAAAAAPAAAARSAARSYPGRGPGTCSHAGACSPPGAGRHCGTCGHRPRRQSQHARHPHPHAAAGAPTLPARPANQPPARASAAIDEAAFSKAYASPSVRKFARELGADLGRIKGTGAKGRITQDDVKAHVKAHPDCAGRAAAAPVSPLPKVPAVDFALFGAVEIKPLSRIQKISGARLQASWINLPHVTQHEDADITDLEAARTALKAKAAEEGVRLTPLAFIIRACVLGAARNFRASTPRWMPAARISFSRSISTSASRPIRRTAWSCRSSPNADRLNIYEIARALADDVGKGARGQIEGYRNAGRNIYDLEPGRHRRHRISRPSSMRRRSPSSGVSKSSQKPVYDKGAFMPRLILPLSLSYDHRVIDGAEAARFVVFLAKVLGDVKASAMSLVEVRVPDLGDAKGVNVVDVLIKKGGEIRVDDPLITLETEKASMDVPSPVNGSCQIPSSSRRATRYRPAR